MRNYNILEARKELREIQNRKRKYEPQKNLSGLYAPTKTYKKVHYLILNTFNKNTSPLIRHSDNELIRSSVYGDFVSMQYHFNRPILNITSVNLVGFEVNINVTQLIDGTGNEGLYNELLKGIDLTLDSSYGNFETQIHHPHLNTNFHIEFKKIILNKYDEHNNLINTSGSQPFTTRSRIEQTPTELKIYNQELLIRNDNTLIRLGEMYDWLSNALLFNHLERRNNFDEARFNRLLENEDYERIGQLDPEQGGRYTITNSTLPARQMEEVSNIRRITNGVPALGLRNSNNFFYEEDFVTFMNNNPNNQETEIRDETGPVWRNNKRVPRGRYYEKPDNENRVYERNPNGNFSEETYDRTIPTYRGGFQGRYAGRYYLINTTRNAPTDQIDFEFRENTNVISASARALISSYIANNNSKQFILDAQASNYIDYLQSFKNRNETNTAFPRLSTTPLTGQSIVTTTETTSTPTTTQTTTADQIHTLSYYNTSTFFQTARASSEDNLPQLDSLKVIISFPHLPTTTATKLLNKLKNLHTNNRVHYNLTLGACVTN